ncbi:MAG: ribonuclease HII [bacterium]|nr:ribonuclease HII [bacterium]
MSVVVGCDEAGRGPLAGPVVAAAVTFRDCETLWKCKDSKSLSPARREALFEEIVEYLEYSVVRVESIVIDEVNIRMASLNGMSQAVAQLNRLPNIVLVDGRDRLPNWPQSRAIIKGDALVATISAASIIAKVTRDRIMREYHIEFPDYGFDQHFGYPTESHRLIIKQIGPCPIHRRSFRGVREFVETN